jgi:twitching motility protein PilT
MLDIDTLLRQVKDTDGSDLHLKTDGLPCIRRHGKLEPVVGQATLSEVVLRQTLEHIAPERAWKRFVESGDADFAYAIAGVGRFRVNIFRQEHGAGSVMRLIPEVIVPLAKLGLPPAVERFAHLRDGFVVVTGPTGSGKSTTLAAIVDCINSSYAKHIVTIEDPVEFLHQNKQSVVSHREVGADTSSFADAVRVATREDADVLLLGELRDQETISRALDAAELGILVLATLHTNSAASTVDRIVSVFPGGQQAMVRAVLAGSLAGIVSQTLVPKAGGRGRVAALEILFRTSAVAGVIRDGNIGMIDSIIRSGKAAGMQLLDDALEGLVASGQIEPKDAYLAAREKSRFDKNAVRKHSGQTTARIGH